MTDETFPGFSLLKDPKNCESVYICCVHCTCNTNIIHSSIRLPLYACIWCFLFSCIFGAVAKSNGNFSGGFVSLLKWKTMFGSMGLIKYTWIHTPLHLNEERKSIQVNEKTNRGKKWMLGYVAHVLVMSSFVCMCVCVQFSLICIVTIA